MSGNRLPEDAQMRAWRLAGKFVCNCNGPKPELIGAFQSYECRGCRKLYFGHSPTGTRVVEQLIRYVLDEVGGAA